MLCTVDYLKHKLEKLWDWEDSYTYCRENVIPMLKLIDLASSPNKMFR